MDKSPERRMYEHNLCLLRSQYEEREAGLLYCNSTFDEMTCWPSTPAGSLAILPCPVTDFTLHNQNATYFCLPNGTWERTVNYLPCLHYDHDYTLLLSTQGTSVRLIYLVGYAISTLALLVAISIFFFFKSLRCLRSIIHCHLMASFALKNIMYITIQSMIEHVHNTDYEWLCKLKVTIINYLNETNFFWMFIEGLYLFSMIVWAFSASKIRHWQYVVVGWIFPVIVTGVWATMKAIYDDKLCWLPGPITSLDFIVLVPIIVILACNVFFMGTIVWILVTKLRASSSLETRQYRKAARAIVVLFPLLGLTYLLMFYGPKENTRMYNVFRYGNAILQTLQGFLVALFYCFLNGEVQAMLKKKLSIFRGSRGVLKRNTKSSIAGSPIANYSFQTTAVSSCNGTSLTLTGKNMTSNCQASETICMYHQDEE